MADEFTKAALYGIKTFNKKVKEKIGMEKLIELLNEFINKTIYPYDRGAKCIGYENHLFLFETGTDVLEDTVISARYGFIKWLVENDKISNDGIKPRTDLVKEITIVDYKTGDAIGWKNKYTEVEQLIMYLSIQDEPIRFLCEILK